VTTAIVVEWRASGCIGGSVSSVGEKFVAAFGAPDPATANGLHFSRRIYRDLWEELHGEIGSGWFGDGFLYLFGADLDALRPCLEAWPFLVPPNEDRMILGRNAYGAILVLDNANDVAQRVFILDPFTLTYDSDPNMRLENTIGNWLPNGGWHGRGELPTFLDDRAYQQWRKLHGIDDVRLDFDDVLGIKIPRALNGTMAPDNVQLDDIVSYYRTTAPIYAETFARLRDG
jgi:hypothetical protein